MRLHDDTVKIISKMREILTPEGAWIKHTLARDFKGVPVLPSSSAATCFCLVGAFARSAYELGGHDTEYSYREFEEIFGMNIPLWNDDIGRTHAEVLAKLDDILADPVIDKELV